MPPDADHDEQVSRLAVYERARDASAERALVTATVLGKLDRLTAGPAPRAPWAALFDDADDADADDADDADDGDGETQLLASKAVYREAAATIATPVARSLRLFLR